MRQGLQPDEVVPYDADQVERDSRAELSETRSHTADDTTEYRGLYSSSLLPDSGLGDSLRPRQDRLVNGVALLLRQVFPAPEYAVDVRCDATGVVLKVRVECDGVHVVCDASVWDAYHAESVEQFVRMLARSIGQQFGRYQDEFWTPTAGDDAVAFQGRSSEPRNPTCPADAVDIEGMSESEIDAWFDQQEEWLRDGPESA